MQMKGGRQSSVIELISGLPPAGALKKNQSLESQKAIKEPFIFAINDQELEMNNIENSLILATKVGPEQWIRIWNYNII